MVKVLLLRLDFHTEYPNGASDNVNICVFPDLSLAAGLEASMIVWRWDTALDSNMLASYTHTVALMTKQHIVPITGGSSPYPKSPKADASHV